MSVWCLVLTSDHNFHHWTFMDLKMEGCRFSLSVSFAIFVIALLYFSTLFIFLSQWFGLWSSSGMLNAFAFTTILVFCICNYVLAMFTNPGRVPTSFVLNTEDDNIILEIKPKGGDLRYCQRCALYRPPRAHHCIKCDACVLRMDHHCIWINNCVGHANYNFFFISAFYAVTACGYSLVLGQNPFCWLCPCPCPIRKHISSGRRFPTAVDKMSMAERP